MSERGKRKAPAGTGARFIVKRRKKNNPRKPPKTTSSSHTIGRFEARDLAFPPIVNLLNEQNKGVLGVYENDNDPCLVAGENAVSLCSRLMIYQSEYHCTLGTIWVATARSIGKLVDPAWKRQKEHCLFILREAIQEGLARRDREFLADIDKNARPNQGNPGRPVSLQVRRHQVDALEEHLLKSKSLKSLQTGKHVESGAHALSSRFSKLYRDAYNIWFYMFEPTLDALSEPMKNRFRTLGFRLPRQIEVLRQAIQTGRDRLQNQPRPRR